MKIEYKQNRQHKGVVDDLVTYFENAKDGQLWEYFGMRVELDPTVDFISQNVLIRWLDIDEGFNDKLIINSLREFQSVFKILK